MPGAENVGQATAPRDAAAILNTFVQIGSKTAILAERVRKAADWFDQTRLGNRAALAFVLGSAAVLSLPPFSIFLLLPVSFGGVILLLRGTGLRISLITGWSFGFGFFLIGISWIAESFFIDAERFGWMAIPAVVGLSAFLAMFAAFPCGIYSQFKTFGVSASFVFALSWTGFEWLRGHLFTGFPWNLIGYVWADYAAPRQAAALIGSYGLSFLTMMLALLPATLVFARTCHERRIATLLFFFSSFILWSGGWLRLNLQTEAASAFTVRIVQGNISQSDKWSPALKDDIFNRYLFLSASPGSYDILVWPEAAFPGHLDQSPEALNRIGALLPPRSYLLTGTPQRVNVGSALEYRNAILAIGDEGAVTGFYSKHHLVPFGEYVPWRRWLPIERLVPNVADFSPGFGPSTLSLGPSLPSAGMTICYEAIFPGEIIDRQNRPAWIFNATNDAWFGQSLGPWQHFASARMRAVEEGLPMVRAANTGISAVIGPHGNLHARIALGVTGIADVALPLPLSPPPYALYGDLMLLPIFLMAALLAWIVRPNGKLGGRQNSI